MFEWHCARSAYSAWAERNHSYELLLAHCRWLRILEVGLQDLATYLQEQRAAGYTIIGELLCMLPQGSLQ